MTTWNWTDFSGWMSDDSFLGRKWEFLDCENVDIVNNVRYVSGSYEVWLPTELWSSISEEVIAVNDGIYPAFVTGTKLYIGNVDVTATVGWWAYKVEQIWTATLPVTYFFKNGEIGQAKFDWATCTLIGNISTDVPSGVPTATCVWFWRIYYAVANKIYVLDTAVTDPTVAVSDALPIASAWNSNIPFGFTIKHMYFYNNVITAVATSNNSTYIYQLTNQTSSPDVWHISYSHTISWVRAIWATWENNSIFWFSDEAIYQTNGIESQKIKVVWKDEGLTSFTTDAIITIRDSVLYIADYKDSESVLWEYGSVKPWYNRVLTKHILQKTISAMDWNIVVYWDSPKAYYDFRSSYDTLFGNWSVTSLPYEAWMFNQPKTGTALRVGHILPAYSTYSSTSVLASLEIAVITDEMEQSGATAITVSTITTPSTWVATRYTDISIQEINDALSGYSTDFQYVKLVVTWNGWDAYNAIWIWTFYRKTPKLFGINLVHNDIKTWIPQ